jgi:hypothetical protein
MKPHERDELLIRLDERTNAIAIRLDALPCARCSALAAVLSFLSRRQFVLTAAIASAAGAASAWYATR